MRHFDTPEGIEEQALAAAAMEAVDRWQSGPEKRPMTRLARNGLCSVLFDVIRVLERDGVIAEGRWCLHVRGFLLARCEHCGSQKAPSGNVAILTLYRGPDDAAVTHE